MPFPNHPPVSNVQANLSSNQINRQSMISVPGGPYLNTNNANQALVPVPGGAYVNGA